MPAPKRPLDIPEDVKRIFGGYQLLLRDAKLFRPAESYSRSDSRFRRIRPSTKPLRDLITKLRSEYDEWLEWVSDPEGHAAPGGRRKGKQTRDNKQRTTDIAERLAPPPALTLDEDGEPVGGLADLVKWRQMIHDRDLSAERVREVVVMVAVARQALDRLMVLLDGLDRRLAWTDADYDPVELLEAVACAFEAFAPLFGGQRVVNADALILATRQARRQSKRPTKFDVPQERRLMSDRLRQVGRRTSVSRSTDCGAG